MRSSESDPLETPEGVDEKEVDRLYGLPPDEFVGARDELAKALRRDRRREEASWVKGLRKPSAAAAAVNRLVRGSRSRAEALFSATAQLRRAQERLGTGNDAAGEVRRASEAEREAVSALVDAAADLPDHKPLSESTRERVRETLRAVALDEQTRRRVEAGRLTQETTAVGFGPVGGGARPSGRRRAKPAGRRQEPQPGDERRRREQAAREELRRLEARVREARQAVAAAKKAAGRTRRERDRLQKRLDRESSELESSQGRLDRFEEEANQAKGLVDELRRGGRS